MFVKHMFCVVAKLTNMLGSQNFQMFAKQCPIGQGFIQLRKRLPQAEKLNRATILPKKVKMLFSQRWITNS